MGLFGGKAAKRLGTKIKEPEGGYDEPEDEEDIAENKTAAKAPKRQTSGEIGRADPGTVASIRKKGEETGKPDAEGEYPGTEQGGKNAEAAVADAEDKALTKSLTPMEREQPAAMRMLKTRRAEKEAQPGGDPDTRDAGTYRSKIDSALAKHPDFAYDPDPLERRGISRKSAVNKAMVGNKASKGKGKGKGKGKAAPAKVTIDPAELRPLVDKMGGAISLVDVADVDYGAQGPELGPEPPPEEAVVGPDVAAPEAAAPVESAPALEVTEQDVAEKAREFAERGVLHNGRELSEEDWRAVLEHRGKTFMEKVEPGMREFFADNPDLGKDDALRIAFRGLSEWVKANRAASSRGR